MSRRACVLIVGLLTWSCTVTGIAPDEDSRVQISDATARVEDFTLTDQNGRPFSFAHLRGRDTLVFFGFTHCTSICPAAMFKLKLLVASLEGTGQSAPAVVLISVDGDRDTPAVLKDYLRVYPSKFIGLTGDPKAVRGIAAGFKSVFFKGLPYDHAGNYQVEHTSMIYLVDSEGRIRATFFDAPVEDMAETTRRLTTQNH